MKKSFITSGPDLDQNVRQSEAIPEMHATLYSVCSSGPMNKLSKI